jgi:hypothetical protein
MRSRTVECYKDTAPSYDANGYDAKGYNKEGYNREGYNKEGYNKEGYYKDQTNCLPKINSHHKCFKAPPGVPEYDADGNYYDQTKCKEKNKDFPDPCYRDPNEWKKILGITLGTLAAIIMLGIFLLYR